MVALRIVDDFFQESSIVVVQGTRVVWVNDGSEVHSATSMNAADSWDTGILKSGQSGGHTFSLPGSYFYTCKVHEYMTASIRVLPGPNG